MSLKIIFGILVIGILLSNNVSAFLPLTPGTIIIENHFNSTKQGTYNVTQANNVNVNSGGFKLNFINGTNNPINIVNSPAKNQVNITISSTGGGGGVTTLNALAGALNIVCVSGNTTCTSGGTSITVNTAWNVVLTGGLSQTITKGLTLNALTLGGDVAGNNKNIISLSNLNSTKVFQNGNQVIDAINSGTGISISGSGNSRTVTSTVVDTNTAQIKNADGATIGLFGTRTNATQNTIKTLTKTGCITLSDNGTDILIGCTSNGVNSLNFTTSSDFDFNIKPRNMSMISLDGQVFNFKLKPNVVLTNESAQTIAKALTLNSAILGGDMNVGSNAFTNLGHRTLISSTNSGTVCYTNQTTSCGTASVLTSTTNAGKATGSVGVLATPTSNLAKGRNMTGTSPISVTKTNDTDIAISCPTCQTSDPAPKVVINNFNSSSHTIGATSPISISNSSSTHTISCSTCLTTSSSGIAVTLGSNLTSASTTAFTHIWNIAMSANTGNRVSGVLLASTNTAGGAVQVGANMSNTHGQGTCQFSYDSAATTLTTFASVLSTTSSDSAWTTILAGANQPYPINFDCAVATDGTATTLQLNFQAEVSSTVSIKAGSSYIKTP